MNKREYNNTQTFILYGAGNTGRDVMCLLRREGKNVAFFLDANAPSGLEVSGIPVYDPEKIPSNMHCAKIPVIITIFNRDVDVTAITASLRSQGWEIVISFVQFHAWHADALGNRFWLGDPHILEKDSSRVFEARQLWADDKSAGIYSAMLTSRQYGKVEDMPRPNLDEVQYFPSDIKGWMPDLPLRFVDCGAYDGDTLRSMSTLHLCVEAYAAFEPDMDSFRKLCIVGKNLRQPGSVIHLWPCGVSAHAEHVAFACGMGEASHLSTNGDGVLIPCVGLDEVLCGFNPNMVKMDIEGAEPSALSGAVDLIVEKRPRLAISVYHCPDHLWTIPLAVAALGCEYELYLRVHGYNLFDVVLYAVPK